MKEYYVEVRKIITSYTQHKKEVPSSLLESDYEPEDSALLGCYDVY
jgi:hypothetical protein